jgi:hypothetical protein
MNFPLENPIFQFFYWLMNTPGVGGVIVILIVAASILIYAAALVWIRRGSLADEPETYAYPTSALHQHS